MQNLPDRALPPFPSESSSPEAATGFSISAVERDTGLTKDVLRMWERRYGFPLPGRNAHGEREYSDAQVEKLRVLKRLIDRGHRPGKIIDHTLDELQQLAGAGAMGLGPEESPPAIREYLDLIKRHRADDLQSRMSESLHRDGLQRFTLETVVPLNREVGIAWMRGQFEIFEEHLYTEIVQGLLRNAIASLPRDGERPRILLTTLPGEQHQLGLLVVQALLALDRAACFSLGVQTPVRDIVLGATGHDVDIVGLSFSGAYPAAHVAPALAELRGKLPVAVEIWAGGSSTGIPKRPPPGIRSLPRLEDVATALATWRAIHGR